MRARAFARIRPDTGVVVLVRHIRQLHAALSASNLVPQHARHGDIEAYDLTDTLSVRLQCIQFWRSFAGLPDSVEMN